MRIRITEKGIYGAGGEIPVGTEIEVKEAPKGWDGRFAVISDKAEGETPVVNPAPVPDSTYAVKDKGSGWFVIVQGDKEVTKSLRRDDVTGFDEFSDADKAAFVEQNKAEG